MARRWGSHSVVSPLHLQGPGERRVAPTGIPTAGYAPHAPGCAWRGPPFYSLVTTGAGIAPGATCVGGPPAPPTHPRPVGGLAPGVAGGVPAPADRATPRRCTVPGPHRPWPGA